jgi:hypothetical protein
MDPKDMRIHELETTQAALVEALEAIAASKFGPDPVTGLDLLDMTDKQAGAYWYRQTMEARGKARAAIKLADGE